MIHCGSSLRLSLCVCVFVCVCVCVLGSTAPSSAGSKLMTAVNTLKKICSQSVSRVHIRTMYCHTYQAT